MNSGGDVEGNKDENAWPDTDLGSGTTSVHEGVFGREVKSD